MHRRLLGRNKKTTARLAVCRRAKLRLDAAGDYFFPPFGDADWIRPFMLGFAAIVLGFSFFGFFFSRLPRCSPLAMVLSSGPERA